MKILKLIKKYVRIFLDRLKYKFYPVDKLSIRNVKVNNYNIIVMGNEEVGRSILFNKYFELLETNFMKKVVTPDFICFDVGANIGYYSLLFASLAHRGKVYAFEPVPLCYQFLMLNVHINNFKNVNAYNIALGQEKKKQKFFIASDSAFSSLIKPSNKPIDIEMNTLDNFVNENGINKIDILKIDVESAEKFVLEGAKNIFLNKMLSPKIILLELSSFAPSEVIDMLNNFNYKLYHLDRNSRLKPFQCNYSGNVVCIQDEYNLKENRINK
jgi:FkbM family methyltransferase